MASEQELCSGRQPSLSNSGNWKRVHYEEMNKTSLSFRPSSPVSAAGLGQPLGLTHRALIGL